MNTTVSVYTIDIWHATLTGLPYSILKAPPSLRFAKYGYYYNSSSPSFCLQGGSNSLELKLSRLSIAVNLAKLFKRRKLWNATRNVVRRPRGAKTFIFSNEHQNHFCRTSYTNSSDYKFIIKQNFSKYLDIPFRKLFSSLTKIRAWNWFCFLGFACCCHNVRNSVTAKWRQVSLSHVDRWSDFVVFTASKLFFFLMTNDDRILGNHLERQQRSIGGLLVHKMTLLSYIAWEIWQSENEMTKFQRVTQIHWISSASVLHNVSLIISSICPPKTEGILRPTSFSLSLFSEIKI